MTNKLSPRTIFLSIIILGLGFGAVWAAEEEAAGPVDSIEEALSSLIDPFVAALPQKEPPKSALPAAPVTPVVQPPQPANPLSLPGAQELQKKSESELAAEKAAARAAQEKAKLKELPDLVLTGIIFNTAKPQAIINGVVVGVGSRIEGAEVRAITKGAVQIMFDGRTSMLSMETPEKKPGVDQNNVPMESSYP